LSDLRVAVFDLLEQAKSKGAAEQLFDGGAIHADAVVVGVHLLSGSS
jgi:hypothetical protein